MSETYQPIPFYFLNTSNPAELTQEETRKSLLRLKKLGYGGAMLFNKPPDGFSREDYLSEPWFEAIGNFLAAATELQMEIWLNDGWNFPPGDAAGRIEKIAPELKQRRLRRNSNGQLEILECDWGFPAFEEPESSRLFIELTYEEYNRRFAQYFGNTLKGFFSDGDNRRSSHFTRKVLAGSKYYPWPRNFEKIFKGKYGYEILPRMNEVIDEKEPTVCENYWELVSELYQNWFMNNQRWCHAHGLEYTFHTSDTGPLTYERCDRTAVFTEGETLRLLSFSDRPGTDHELPCLDGGTHYDKRYFNLKATFGGPAATSPHFNDTQWDLRAKIAASAAYLGGKKRVLCEAFAATNWNSSVALMKRIAAWQIMQGVNFFVPHAVHHRQRGDVKFFAPPEQTMVPGITELNAFIEHFCFVASQGEYVAPVRIGDTTRAIWRGSKDESLFELCHRLNHQAINYIIVPEGTPVTKEMPAPYATFDGGELAWMLRQLDDGTRYLLAANLWQDTPLSGTICFNGKKYSVLLDAGEIAVLGGPWESYRSPQRILQSRELCSTDTLIPVTWNRPNLIPLFASAIITVQEDIGEISLLVPQGCKARIHGVSPQISQDEIFDDNYDVYRFTATKGEYFLELGIMAPHTHAYLRGNFNVTVSRTLLANYELTVTGPCLELTARQNQLACASWTLQGHPFYSGSAIYHFEVDCTGENQLTCPAVGNVVSLQIDGQEMGLRAYPPYQFSFPSLQGKHRFSLCVENTLANQLEAQSPPSGLLYPPHIETCEV